MLFPGPGSLRGRYYAAADENWRAEKPPPPQSRVKPLFDELERRKDTRSKQDEILEPKEDVELQEDRQAKDCRVEEELEAEVEPATPTGANDVDDKDNESLNENQGSTVRSTHKESSNGSREESLHGTHGVPADGCCTNQSPLDGDHGNRSLDGANEEPVDDNRDHQSLDVAHEAPVSGSHDDQFVDDTHQEAMDVKSDQHSDGSEEEPVDEIRDDQSLDDTREDSVAGVHEKSDEGTYEGTVDNVREGLDDGTCGESISSSTGQTGPDSREEPLSNDSHEAPVSGALQDTSSHREEENPSKRRPSPPRYRGKPKYKRLVAFDNLRPSL